MSFLRTTCGIVVLTGILSTLGCDTPSENAPSPAREARPSPKADPVAAPVTQPPTPSAAEPARPLFPPAPDSSAKVHFALPSYAKELSSEPGIDPPSRLVVMVYTSRTDPASLWKIADAYRARARAERYTSLDVSFFLKVVVPPTDDRDWSTPGGRELTSDELNAVDWANYLWQGGGEDSLMIGNPSRGRKEMRRALPPGS